MAPTDDRVAHSIHDQPVHGVALETTRWGMSESRIDLP